MERQYFDRIGETLYSERLENGMSVFVVPKRGFSKAYAFFAVNYGAADTHYILDGQEHKVPDGIAHFLEHKMFDMERGNALQLLSELGAQPNAFTSTDITAYYFETTENFDESLKLLIEFVSTPYFTQESVEKEQGIIGQEIAMVENNPNWQVYMNLYRALYANHPVRVAVAGTQESIGEITADTLTRCHNTFYVPDNMVLCVVGDVAPEHIADIVKECVHPVSRMSAECIYGPDEPEDVCEHYASGEREISMPLFMAGYKCKGAHGGWAAMKEELVADMAFQIVAGGSTKLYSDMYAEGIINDSFDWNWETCRGTAAMVFGGESRDPRKVVERVQAEAERIAAEGLDAELLRRLKKASVGKSIRSYDSFEAICYAQATAYFKGADCFRLPELTEEITEEEVLEFIREKMIRDKLALSVIYPTKEEQDER